MHADSTQNQRDMIATALLLAVYDSQGLNDVGKKIHKPEILEMHKARRWLRGPIAELYFLTLDIRPDAALDRLQHKWSSAEVRSLTC